MLHCVLKQPYKEQTVVFLSNDNVIMVWTAQSWLLHDGSWQREAA
jgi:hypothetical protein